MLGVSISLLVLFSALGGAVADRLFVIKPLDKFLGDRSGSILAGKGVSQNVVKEENMVINVAKKAGASVVTIGVVSTQAKPQTFSFGPFGNIQLPGSETETVKRDIGSGFLVSEDGLVVTNKHVVADTTAKYNVITKDDKEYEVINIYRDPVNDLAILKVEATDVVPLELGDSSSLEVGQYVVAIGTALGEFRHTVTQGVISGLGRGIQAGDAFGGQIEELDNIIQTDAAINPGNSGGPLLNTAGQVIGVNVAVAGNAQNIGFAIPINIIKASLENFEKTGEFNRAYFGVRYRMIDRETALLNDVPEGAYVVEVVSGSSADVAGVERGDIIMQVDGKKVSEMKGGLAEVVGQKKVGDKVKLMLWRDGVREEIETTLKASSD